MTQTLPVAKTITSLAQAESTFSLSPADNERFFTEWYEALPELTTAEKARLDLIKQRYLYHRKHGPLAEGTVNFIVMSPLLEMVGFYDPPFLLRSEASVMIEVEEQDQIFRGRIDSLVVQNQFWILLVESKQTTFNMDTALPQALTYMMASPHPERPAYGLVSNGAYFMFLKLLNQPYQQYALSEDFSLYRRQNELYGVLRTLKRLTQLMRAL